MIVYRSEVPLTPPQSSPESHGLLGPDLEPEVRIPRHCPAAFLSESSCVFVLFNVLCVYGVCMTALRHSEPVNCWRVLDYCLETDRGRFLLFTS